MSTVVPDARRREEGIRRTIQLVLRGGLAVAVALMVSGVTVSFASGERSAPALRPFDLGHQSVGETFMVLGVLALAVTPLLRVLALIVLWGRQRDARFVIAGVVVLAVLIVSAVVGHG
jgi:uncharacterized membrane protein